MWKQMLWLTVSVLFFSTGNVIGDGNGSSSKKEAPNQIDYDDIVMACNETFRIEYRYLDALNESGSFPDETDRTPKCFLRCILEKSGVASPNGVYDSTQTVMIFQSMRDVSEEDLAEIAESCLDRMEACKCERAYQYMKCLIEKSIKKETASDT